MENPRLVLCDTNIIIEFYKGNPKIIGALKQIRRKNIAISIVTSSELVYGAINKVELNRIIKNIENLTVLSLTSEISSISFDLLKQYSLSHRLNLPDSLIAATAIYHKIPLFTLNIKDFRYLEHLQLYEPA